MKYIPENDLVVVVGGWNPNILQDPNWVKKFLFDETASITGSDNDEPVFRTNKIEVDDVRLTVNVPKLGLGLTKYSDAGLDRIQQIAFNVCNFLPHTPVNAFGINFAYETHVIEGIFTSSIEIETLVENTSEEPSQRKSVFTWTLDTYTLNVSLHRKSDDVMRWDFHYHHVIGSLDEFKGVVEEKPLLEYKKDSLRFVHSLIEDEKGAKS